MLGRQVKDIRTWGQRRQRSASKACAESRTLSGFITVFKMWNSDNNGRKTLRYLYDVQVECQSIAESSQPYIRYKVPSPHQ